MSSLPSLDEVTQELEVACSAGASGDGPCVPTISRCLGGCATGCPTTCTPSPRGTDASICLAAVRRRRCGPCAIRSTSPVATFIAANSRSCRCACSHGSWFQRGLPSSAATVGCGPAPGMGFLVGRTPPPVPVGSVHTNDVDEFLLELGIIADLERLDLPRLEIVIGPNLGHRSLPIPTGPPSCGSTSASTRQRGVLCESGATLPQPFPLAESLTTPTLRDPSHTLSAFSDDRERQRRHHPSRHRTVSRSRHCHTLTRPQKSLRLHDLR